MTPEADFDAGTAGTAGVAAEAADAGFAALTFFSFTTFLAGAEAAADGVTGVAAKANDDDASSIATKSDFFMLLSPPLDHRSWRVIYALTNIASSSFSCSGVLTPRTSDSVIGRVLKID